MYNSKRGTMDIKTIFRISFILACIFTTSDSTSEDSNVGEIVFANVLYRHGDRTPIEPYPNDPYASESFWPVPYGQLTKIGEHQHLLLGRWLRNRYSHLLNDTYSRYDIYVQSTDVDRTLMSAEANLAGLYPPAKEQVWDSDIKWMPIPVHTSSKEEDYILGAKKLCPRYKFELNKLLKSPEFVHINKQNADLYEYLSMHSGNHIHSLKTAEELYDCLYIENLHNKTLPWWTTTVFPDVLKPIAILSFKISAYNKILQRLKSGPLLGNMIDHMVKKSQKALVPDRKLWVYSAHDETVVNLLMTLGVFEPHLPPYAATILIELRRNLENQYFVTISYKNHTEEMVTMTLPGCTKLCPLNKFIHLTSDVVPEDWEKECILAYWENCSYSFSEILGIVTFLLFTLLVTLLVVNKTVQYTRRRMVISQYTAI